MDDPLFESFFVKEEKITISLLYISKRNGNDIWKYLTLADLLNLSVCSRACASFQVSKHTLNLLIRNSKLSTLGTFVVSFSADTNLGICRRMINRIATGTDAIVSIDSKSGRVVMDIGSAFRDNDTFFTQEVEPISETLEPFEEDHRIQKYLEVASFDEYDDFNPRHPLPKDKDKGHRRGNSYFNSDIESVAAEAVSLSGLDLSGIGLGSWP